VGSWGGTVYKWLGESLSIVIALDSAQKLLKASEAVIRRFRKARPQTGAVMNFLARKAPPVALKERLLRQCPTHSQFVAILAHLLLLRNVASPLFHDEIVRMKKIGISEFRVKYCAILDRVRKTGQPIRVTRYGRPLADIMPPSPAKRRLGCVVGTGRIIGDIVGPTGSLDDWEVGRG
jgi:prevent-host-death family protein